MGRKANIYFVYDCGELIQKMSSEQIRNEIGIDQTNIMKYRFGSGRRYKSRYEFDTEDSRNGVSLTEEEKEEFEKRWNRITNRCKKGLETSTWKDKRRVLDELQPKWRKELSKGARK